VCCALIAACGGTASAGSPAKTPSSAGSPSLPKTTDSPSLAKATFAIASPAPTSSVAYALPGADASTTVVASVDGHAVELGELERWTAIESVLAHETYPSRPAPVGVVPDPPAYSRCIAYLAATSAREGQGAAPTRSALETRCREKYTRLQRHILEILITYYWLKGEAGERGLVLSEAEALQMLDSTFSSPAKFRRFLSLTGESPADERLIIEKDLYDSKLEERVEGEARAKGLTSAAQHEQVLIAAARAFTAKWKARTTCRSDFVIAVCRQYGGAPQLVLP
jgi:hypothetical protein